MFLTKLTTATLVLATCPTFTGTGFLVHPALAENPPQAQAKAEPNAANQGVSNAVTDLTPAQFSKFHALLRPKAEEMRFGEIPWLFNLWEARTKAAAEGMATAGLTGIAFMGVALVGIRPALLSNCRVTT